MPGWFFDSSALAKRYHPEPGTERVDEIISGARNRICISRLTLIEMRSVFAIKARAGAIASADTQLFAARFQEDIALGRFDVFTIGEREFARAEDLLERHALDRRLRSLDAIQLSVAIGLWHHGGIEYFVASDRVLCDVAAREGTGHGAVMLANVLRSPVAVRVSIQAVRAFVNVRRMLVLAPPPAPPKRPIGFIPSGSGKK